MFHSIRATRAASTLAVLLASAAVLGCSDSSDDDEVGNNACLQYSASGAVYDPGTPGAGGAPEIPTGFASKKTAFSRSFMVVAANPLATKAGCEVLKKGGTAVDAAIATQMVLNLVEPQSSGIGGGAFMLHYKRDTGTVTAYDGRETAPAAATENYLRWISDTQQTTPLPNARASGRSIGTPGVLHMLDAAHKDAGKLTWKELFDPAIKIATDGFKISPRMGASIAGSASSLARDPRPRLTSSTPTTRPRPPAHCCRARPWRPPSRPSPMAASRPSTAAPSRRTSWTKWPTPPVASPPALPRWPI
jgi:gamma-glutamyltranspeptidase/glutathione hydrolase